jgi:hypothetical protein
MDSFAPIDLGLCAAAASANPMGAFSASSSSSASPVSAACGSPDDVDVPLDFEVRQAGTGNWYCVVA